MKKKIVFLSILALALCCFVSADGKHVHFKLTSNPKEFTVEYLPTKDMKEIPCKENEDIPITKAYSISSMGIEGETRLTLFTDMGTTEENWEKEVITLSIVALYNAAGFEVPLDQISTFNEDDVKKEFNADFGLTTTVQNPTSDYAEGYNYMTVEFFYKKGQGVVMRTFLFNDIAFAGLTDTSPSIIYSPLYKNYHSFKFMRKNVKGKFIKVK